jgi:hypothetical protein
LGTIKYSTRQEGKKGEERKREGKTYSPMEMHGIKPGQVVVNEGCVNSHAT